MWASFDELDRMAAEYRTLGEDKYHEEEYQQVAQENLVKGGSLIPPQDLSAISFVKSHSPALWFVVAAFSRIISGS